MRKVRHQYDDANDEKIGQQAATVNVEPSLTQQQYTDDVNLNVMMARMGVKDGAIPPMSLGPIADFGEATTLMDVFAQVHDAEEKFSQLPADIKKYFNHSPARMMEFLDDPANIDEGVRLGLFHESKKEEPPAPIEVRVVNPAPPATETPKT